MASPENEANPKAPLTAFLPENTLNYLKYIHTTEETGICVAQVVPKGGLAVFFSG